MATLASKGDLICGASVVVDGTADTRWVRATVYNRDSVDHEFTLLLGATPIKKRVVLPGKDFTFPLLAVPAGDDLAVSTATAMATAEPTYAISGTH